MQNYSYPSASTVTITGIGDPTGQPVPTNAVYVAGDNPSGNLAGLKVDNSGNLLVSLNAQPLSTLNINLADVGGVAVSLGQKVSASSIPIVIASDQSTINVLQPDSSTSGSVTSTQSVTIAINGFSTVGISVTGTWTGTLAIEGSVDGTNYNSTTAAFLASGQLVSNITSNAQYQSNVSGLASFRIRGNTITSGTAVIAIRASQAAAMVMLDNPIPAGSATIGAVNQAGTWTVQPGNTANTTPWLTTISQGGNSATVSATGALKVDASASTQPVSGTVTANQGGTWTVQPGNTANTTPWLSTISQGGNSASVTASNALKVDGSAVTQPVSGSVTVSGTVTANAGTGTFTTSEMTSSTSSVTSVASSATNVQLLASNASRKNAMFFNDSTQILYLKLGTTASTTSYTVQIAAGGYYELPVGKIYTGEIDGIWASANGNARITELT